MNLPTAALTRLSLSTAAAIYLLAAPAGAHAAAAVEYAFAYTYQPSPGAAWQLHGSHTFNSTGGGVGFTRLGTGDYLFTLGNMSPFGNAHARAHGSSNRCKVVNWTAAGSDTQVRVRCLTPAGAAVDDLTVIQYYHAAGTDSLQTAYLWANLPAAASYAPSAGYSYNSTGAVNTIAHGVELGEYLAFLPGLSTRGGDPHVTAYGTTGDYCKIGSWYQSGGAAVVAVRCFNAAGDPVDSMWTLRYTHGHTADDGRFLGAYALGNADWGPGTPLHTYTPAPAFQFHTSGVTMVADNESHAQVHMPGTLAISSALVTAVGHDNTYCSTFGWTNFGTEYVPVAACYDPAGNPLGAGFTMTLLTLAPR